MMLVRGKSGVYAIRNVVNGKTYVGSAAKCIGHRWDTHKSDLRKGKHHSQRLQRAWNKYGESSFAFIVLELCDSLSCIKREQFYIDSMKSCDCQFGYNIVPKAGSHLGHKHSAESRKRMSDSAKGRKPSPESIAKGLETRRGFKHSKETKNRLAELARNISEETREKRRAAARNRSDEYKKKHSASLKGRVITEEWKAKLTAARRRRAERERNDPIGIEQAKQRSLKIKAALLKHHASKRLPSGVRQCLDQSKKRQLRLFD